MKSIIAIALVVGGFILCKPQVENNTIEYKIAFDAPTRMTTGCFIWEITPEKRSSLAPRLFKVTLLQHDDFGNSIEHVRCLETSTNDSLKSIFIILKPHDSNNIAQSDLISIGLGTKEGLVVTRHVNPFNNGHTAEVSKGATIRPSESAVLISIMDNSKSIAVASLTLLVER